MRRPLLLLLVPLLALTAGYLVMRARRWPPIQKQTRFLMDTYCTIQACGGPEVRGAVTQALDRMQEVERRFNSLGTEGPLHAFNHEGVPVSDADIVRLVDTALEVSRMTDGAFDITVFPLLKLWGFLGGSPHLPPEAEVAECLYRIGWTNLNVRGGQLSRSRHDIEIDLGGIAKGLAVAEAVEVLRDNGIESALVDAGGDLYALGMRYGRPWRVGIRKPRSGGGIFARLDVTDRAVVTSGDYERCFEEGGVRYHHILDPKTGFPAAELASVTVLFPDPTVADAMATALFVMGPDKGMALVERTADLECVMVTRNGQPLVSSGARAVLNLLSDPVAD